jgi:hypothetical protein
MDGEAYKIQHDHYQRAAGFIREALEHDEKSSRLFFDLVLFLNHNIDNPELAISLYRQGIQELEKAINVNVDPNGKRRN